MGSATALLILVVILIEGYATCIETFGNYVVIGIAGKDNDAYVVSLKSGNVLWGFSLSSTGIDDVWRIVRYRDTILVVGTTTLRGGSRTPYIAVVGSLGSIEKIFTYASLRGVPYDVAMDGSTLILAGESNDGRGFISFTYLDNSSARIVFLGIANRNNNVVSVTTMHDLVCYALWSTSNPFNVSTLDSFVACMDRNNNMVSITSFASPGVDMVTKIAAFDGDLLVLGVQHNRSFVAVVDPRQGIVEKSLVLECGRWCDAMDAALIGDRVVVVGTYDKHPYLAVLSKDLELEAIWIGDAVGDARSIKVGNGELLMVGTLVIEGVPRPYVATIPIEILRTKPRELFMDKLVLELSNVTTSSVLKTSSSAKIYVEISRDRLLPLALPPKRVGIEVELVRNTITLPQTSTSSIARTWIGSTIVAAILVVAILALVLALIALSRKR